MGEVPLTGAADCGMERDLKRGGGYPNPRPRRDDVREAGGEALGEGSCQDRKVLHRLRGERFSHSVEQLFGVAPGETGIGDRHAVRQSSVRIPVLPAAFQVTFQHETHDGAPAPLELFQDVAGHFNLALMVLPGVVVRTVHHYAAGQPFACHGRFGASDVLDAVVRASAAAAQDDVMIGIPGGFDD